MNRIDRLTAILVHLQSKSRVPLDELSERFELSRRTVFRDIRALMEAGVPIGGDAGEGYFIVEGYHLPPVVFNREEAAAMLLGAKLIEKNADERMVAHFREAMYKVKAVLRYREKEFVENLEKSVSVLGSPATAAQGFPDSHLPEIQLALATRKMLRLRYRANYTDETTEREVEPLSLVYYSGRWHLIGYCKLRNDLRDFRTDRIEKITIQTVSFDPERHAQFPHFLENLTGGDRSNEAVVAFTRKMARFIQEQKYHYGFVEEKREGDIVEMRFLTPRYEFLAQWLAGFGKEVEVLYPDSLRLMIVEMARELLLKHDR